MGKLNLLKASYSGRVGETVGAKWKDQNTVRVFTKPSNPNTQAQQTVRKGFGDTSKFVALFSDQIKTLTALNTRSMSVRNAILKLNKAMVAAGTFEADQLVISTGGLPTPVVGQVQAAQADGNVTIPVTAIQGTNITAKAKIVAVVVSQQNGMAWVGTNDNQTANITVATGLTGTDPLEVYVYAIDYRNSAKVGSVSTHRQVTPA